MVLRHHLQCCESLMIPWLGFCIKYSRLHWIQYTGFVPYTASSKHVFPQLSTSSGADLSSSPLSQWVIKQRERERERLGKQLWWRALAFHSPPHTHTHRQPPPHPLTPRMLLYQHRGGKDERETKAAHVSRVVSVSDEGEAQPLSPPSVTPCSLSQQTSTSPCITDEVTSSWFTLTNVTAHILYRRICDFLLLFCITATEDYVMTYELISPFPKWQIFPCCSFSNVIFFSKVNFFQFWFGKTSCFQMSPCVLWCFNCGNVSDMLQINWENDK